MEKWSEIWINSDNLDHTGENSLSNDGVLVVHNEDKKIACKGYDEKFLSLIRYE